jgi:protein-disulfide isomerase-like protein with CxxC motif
MIRSDGGNRIGEDETTVVASERRIMLRGNTDSGARLGSMFCGATGGMEPGRSATVEVRRSEECMLRRCCCFGDEESRLKELCLRRSRDDESEEMVRGEERRFRRPGRRIARRPGAESIIETIGMQRERRSAVLQEVNADGQSDSLGSFSRRFAVHTESTLVRSDGLFCL